MPLPLHAALLQVSMHQTFTDEPIWSEVRCKARTAAKKSEISFYAVFCRAGL